MLHYEIDGNHFIEFGHKKYIVQALPNDSNENCANIYINGKDINLEHGRIVYCIYTNSDGVTRFTFANGENNLDVKEGEVFMTECLRGILTVGVGKTIEIKQVCPTQPFQSSFVVVKIVGGEILTRENIWIPLNLKGKVCMWPTHLKAIVKELWNKIHDKIVTCGESREIEDITISTFLSDMTPANTKYRNLRMEVTFIKTFEGELRAYEYVTTKSKLVLENITDSYDLLTDLRQRMNDPNNYPDCIDMTQFDEFHRNYQRENGRLEKEEQAFNHMFKDLSEAKKDIKPAQHKPRIGPDSNAPSTKWTKNMDMELGENLEQRRSCASGKF